MIEQKAYKVYGLDCAEEVALLNKEIGHHPGVKSLEFNVLKARMNVTYDTDEASSEGIVHAVSKTGMKATLWEAQIEKREISFWKKKGRMVMTLFSGGCLLAGFLFHWWFHQSLTDALAIGVSEDQHLFPMGVILLYTISIVFGAWFIFPKALLAARRVRPDMNFLMVIAVIGAVAIGEWLEAATVTFLFAVALLLESWSVERASKAIETLLTLSPTMARTKSPKDGTILELQVDEVTVGMTVLVQPGEKIPLDGMVLKGSSTVNQAPITGESIPVSINPGDDVFAGTINEDGAFEFEVTKLANDTTLARIVHQVQEAQSRRAPSEQWVEKFARYYTPLMMLLATSIILLPPLFFHGEWKEWIYRGLVILVVACPCALVISTPVSIVSALAAAARNGVLIKGGKYLETVAHLRAFGMDKTGTLTRGRPEVQKIVPQNDHSRENLLEIAAALEANSEHPLARAILKQAKLEGIMIRPAEHFQITKGKGAEAKIDGKPYWIGSHRMMHEKGIETSEIHRITEELEDAGHSVVVIGTDQHICGLISVADAVRPESFQVVKSLKALGIENISMFTGDNRKTAEAVAKITGVDNIHSEMLPEDKVSAVESLVQQFKYVGMIGDGVNDAPAMAVSTVGIAMGAMGTDAAIETADIALMADDLSRIPWLVQHARKALVVIKQNIAFALGLKLVFIVLTFFGLASLWLAIAADMGASLLVIGNGLRLLNRTEVKTL